MSERADIKAEIESLRKQVIVHAANAEQLIRDGDYRLAGTEHRRAANCASNAARLQESL